MIEMSRHPSGRVGNVLLGFAFLADGFVIVLSLGHLHSRFALELSKYQMMRKFKSFNITNKE